MQVMPCLFRASVVIIILPLNAISAEQKAKIKNLGYTPSLCVRRDDIRSAVKAYPYRHAYSTIPRAIS